MGPQSFNSHSVIGGGGQFATNYELIRNKLVVLANVFWSDGGAHYLVERDRNSWFARTLPATTSVFPWCMREPALPVSSGEQARKQAFAVYYGADYLDAISSPTQRIPPAPDTIIGYGGPGSPNTNNRAIQQITFDWLLTFWKSERYGALQYYTQYSYLTRAPWFVAPDDPKNAHLSMVYVGAALRFAVDFGHPAPRAVPELERPCVP